MAENFSITSTLKEKRYKELLPQIIALTKGESDYIANLCNVMAALKFGMNFFWVGCYFVKSNSLVLGPFQGTIACTRIAFGQGVCGTSWKKKETIIVPDVSTFSGHIACSSSSKSEIVIPGFDTNGNVKLILDIDSEMLNDFDETDSIYLNQLMRLLEKMN